MKRQIIKIDEAKCTGCGQCVSQCPEGALKVIDGKARLVGELLCDGLGACLGHCPEGAITVEEREAEAYDEKEVIRNIIAAGPRVLAAHLKHLKDHGQQQYLTEAVEYMKENQVPFPPDDPVPSPHAGCPGMMTRDFRGPQPGQSTPAPAENVASQLRQWPIQLHLLNPAASYFQNAEVVVAADCVPFAYGKFHDRFLKGKALIIFCPKLDHAYEAYLSKLTEIFKRNTIKSVTILHMEVPCCYGTVSLVEEAVRASGQNILVKDYTISLQGEII